MRRNAGMTTARRLVATTALGAVLAWGSAFAAAIPAGQVSGRITDLKTGEPLIGAAVTVKGLRLGAMCNTEGIYKITRVPVGQHRLIARMIGYQDKMIRAVRVGANSTATADIALQRIGEGRVQDQRAFDSTGRGNRYGRGWGGSVPHDSDSTRSDRPCRLRQSVLRARRITGSESDPG